MKPSIATAIAVSRPPMGERMIWRRSQKSFWFDPFVTLDAPEGPGLALLLEHQAVARGLIKHHDFDRRRLPLVRDADRAFAAALRSQAVRPARGPTFSFCLRACP